MDTNRVVEISQKVRENISKVMVGRNDTIDLLLTALLAKGHVLLDDVPGIGKKMMAKCLAKSISIELKRVQFTPDLLPSDLTGLNVYSQKTSTFNFKEGPIFTNILLAAEINRATPRTQSSLLECMEERQVTVDGVTRKLDSFFLVIATQNPLETQGIFPLPEAQNDRFFCRLKNGHPTKGDGFTILTNNESKDPFDDLTPVTTKAEIEAISQETNQVLVSQEIQEYMMNIVEETRNHEQIIGGISPRASIALLKGIQAYAAIKGRTYAIPEDVKYLSQFCLPHRLTLRGTGAYSKSEAQNRIIGDILENVPMPSGQAVG